MIPVYEEIIQFLAAGATSHEVAEFQPSQATLQRVTDLLSRRKQNALSAEENQELNHFLELEHLMRLTKARARQHLAA